MSAFRVFTSSTFKNFETERNYLEQNLYTPLNNLCREKGYAFHAIDLRWGISSEASLDNKSMLLCLDEIRKCQETDIKPNFLIMLGDYYGWKPLPFTIEETEAQMLFIELTPSMRELFLKCYKLDTNNIPNQYVLQGRQCEFIDDNVWHKIETQLHEALETAAKKMLSEEKLDKYLYSATHQEIIQGFFKDDIIKDYTFVFVKEDGNIYDNENDFQNAQTLKRKVISILPESQYAVYKSQQDFPLAVQKAKAFLEHTISNEIKKLVRVDKQELLEKELKNNYLSDKELEIKIIESINNSQGKKIFIVAGKNQGKTSLVLNIFSQLKTSAETKYYLWCANSDYDHLSILGLCRFIIAKCTEGEKKPYLDYDNACYFVQKELDDFSDSIKKSRQIFFIDGLEELFDAYRLKELFYNIILPKNIVFVITTSQKNDIKKNSLQYTIMPFSEKKKELLFDSILSEAHRLITDIQRIAILPVIHNGDPLFIRMLANKFKTIHSYELICDTNTSIDDFIKNEIRDLSAPTMYGEILVSRIMLFLSFSPFGISETEILELLRKDNKVVRYLKAAACWDFDETLGIPKVILYRIMADIRSYVMELNDKGDIIYRLKSQYLAEIIRGYYDENSVNEQYDFYKNYIKKKKIYINPQKQIDQRIARQWLYITSKEEDELIAGLNSLDFCDALLKLGEIQYLIDGFKRTKLTDTPFYKIISKYSGQLVVCPEGFLTYIVSENIINIKNYKKFVFENESDRIKKITNWMNDKIKFCHILSEKEYVISCENSLIKINREKKEIVEKLNFNAQIVKCQLSDDSNKILVICANNNHINNSLHFNFIDLKNWCLINDREHCSTVRDNIYDSSVQTFSYENNFIVIISGFNASYIYFISDETCDCIKTFSTSCRGIPLAEKYILLKIGFRKFGLFETNRRQLIWEKNSAKYLKFDLSNSIVADDGNTFCFIPGQGMFKFFIKKGALKIKKIFQHFSMTPILEFNVKLLPKCLLVKARDEIYTDIYNYNGIYLGKTEWNGADYVIDVCNNKVFCVDIGGRIYEMEIDTSIVFDQKKINLSLFEYWKSGITAFARAFNIFRSYAQNSNCKSSQIISPDGKYIARLTKDGLSVFEDGRLVFDCLYRSKKEFSRDIRFISNRRILWKRSHQIFKIIDLGEKRLKPFFYALKKDDGYIFIDDTLFISRNKIIKRVKEKSSVNLFNPINVLKSNVDIKNEKFDFCNPIEMIKVLRKNNDAKIVFSYPVHAQLQFNKLENDQILYISNEYIVRLYNQKIFFYHYNKKDKLINACVFYQYSKPDKSKISVYADVYYFYCEPLKIVLIYNKSGKQIIPYLLDDSVSDVAFDKNIIRILYSDLKVDIIHIE